MVASEKYQGNRLIHDSADGKFERILPFLVNNFVGWASVQPFLFLWQIGIIVNETRRKNV